MRPETIIENHLRGRVTKLKGEYRKVKWVNRRGAPDELVWIPKWSFPKLAETKAPGEPLEDHQEREHLRLAKMGFECYKLDSIEDVEWFLALK